MTQVFPPSALWMSAIMCDSPYYLDHATSHFECVSGAGSYDANYFAIMGLQALLIAFVCAAGLLVWRLLRKRRQSL